MDMISRKQAYVSIADLFREAADLSTGVVLESLTLTDNRGADGTVAITAHVRATSTGKLLADTYVSTPYGLEWVNLEEVAQS